MNTDKAYPPKENPPFTDHLSNGPWSSQGNSTTDLSSGSIRVHPWRKKALAVAFSFSCLLHSAAFAQETYYSTLFIPHPLEDFNGAPRPGGLGSAFTAMESDTACLYFNPAGLATLTQARLSLYHNQGLADISRTTLEVSSSLEGAGTFALAVNYSDFGTLEGWDDLGGALPSFHPFRLGVALGWGFPLSKTFSIGLGAREFFESLASSEGALSFSFVGGVLAKPLPRWSFGAFYSCLYSRNGAEMGLFKAGAAWEAPLDPRAPTLLLLDLSCPPQGVYRVQVGAEQVFLGSLSARLGYQLEFVDSGIEGLRGLSAGLGAKFDDILLDCSFSPNGDLGDFRSLSLTYRFPEPSQPPVSFKPSPDPAAGNVTDVEVVFEIPDGGRSGRPLSPGERTELEVLSGRVQVDPKDLQAWQGMALLYWRSGQAAYAIQCFEEVLRLSPGNERLRTWLKGYKEKTLPGKEEGEAGE